MFAPTGGSNASQRRWWPWDAVSIVARLIARVGHS